MVMVTTNWKMYLVGLAVSLGIFLVIYFIFKNKVTKMTLSMNLQAVDMLKNLATGTKTH